MCIFCFDVCKGKNWVQGEKKLGQDGINIASMNKVCAPPPVIVYTGNCRYLNLGAAGRVIVEQYLDGVGGGLRIIYVMNSHRLLTGIPKKLLQMMPVTTMLDKSIPVLQQFE